jgi:hypothetical protein
LTVVKVTPSTGSLFPRLDYNPDEDDDDEAGYRFGAHAFVPGEYVSISGQDGKLHAFLVVAVDPVVLSVDLVKSFQLEIKV